MSKASLTEVLKSCHQQLDEMFLQHQEKLLLLDLPAAMRLLDNYWAVHALHMEFENEMLLPAYKKLKQQGRWDATLYEQEHQKIEDLYGKTRQGLAWLVEQELTQADLRRNIIHLLDREKSFKGLCEHHQEREEVSLFVELDRQTDAHWRAGLLEKFLGQWHEATGDTGFVLAGDRQYSD